MDILKCPKCSNLVLNNSRYCVNCGLYLLDDQKFIDSAIESIRKEKNEILGDVYFVISDSVDSEIKRSLDKIAKQLEYIYDTFEGRPYKYEDTRLLICKTLYKTLREVSDLTDLQRKKVEHRAQKVSVIDWLGSYQVTLEEIKESLAEKGESDIDVDIQMLSSNEAVEWYMNAD